MWHCTCIDRSLLFFKLFSRLVAGLQARTGSAFGALALLRSRDERTELGRKHAAAHLRRQQPGACDVTRMTRLPYNRQFSALFV